MSLTNSSNEKRKSYRSLFIIQRNLHTCTLEFAHKSCILFLEPKEWFKLAAIPSLSLFWILEFLNESFYLSLSLSCSFVFCFFVICWVNKTAYMNRFRRVSLAMKIENDINFQYDLYKDWSIVSKIIITIQIMLGYFVIHSKNE